MIKSIYAILSFLIIKCNLNKCMIDDYEKIFGPCNLNTNKRQVIIYKKNNHCDDSIQRDSLLILYSKTPSFKVNCDYKCPPGQIIDFNAFDNKLYCKKCPKNTYSLGGDFTIKFWNDDVLSLFDINCHIIKDNVKYKNTNCTKAFVSQDLRSITSGRMISNEPEQYIFEIIYSFEAKYDGSITIRYKKGTIHRDNFLNGEANFFFDYDLILKDNNTTDWSVFKHSFNKGYHQIALFYSYWKDYTDQELVFTLDKFHIEGLDQSIFKCSKCIDSISSEGSSHCSKCNEYSVFSYETKQCINCPKGTVSINGIDCIKASQCNSFDYELKSIGDCNFENTQKIIQKPILPILCFKKNKKSNDFVVKTEIPCLNQLKTGKYSLRCAKNDYYLNNYKILREFYYPNEVFDTIIDWKSNGLAMFIQRNPVIKKEMKLEKIINITSHTGYIKLGINLAKNENVLLSLNDTTEIITSSDVYTFNLKKGVYILDLIYYRKEYSSQEELFIPVELYLLQIVGSSQYTTLKSLCQPCPPGIIADKNICRINELQSTNSNSSPNSECPTYTHKKIIDNNSTCVLDDIIESKKYNIKFNIKPYFKYLDDYCQSHPLCYQNNFIGPLNYSKGVIDLSFYFSLFEQHKFITNLTANNTKTFNQSGHLFVFANVKEDTIFIPNHHNRFIFTQSLADAPSALLQFFSSTKLPIYIEKKAVINIGNIITSVKLIDYETENGIIVKYSNGGKCRNDPSKLYMSYVYYKCDKSITGFSFPKITHYFYNHCGMIFEVLSPYFCKICSSSELTYSSGKCISAKRAKIYDDIPTCIFDYLKQDNDYQYDYSIDSQNVLLSAKSKVHQLLFSNKNNTIKTMLKQKDKNYYYLLDDFEEAKGHYLNNRIEYESCHLGDMIESYFKHFIVFIGILYSIVISMIIVVYIKYRALKNQNNLVNERIDIVETRNDKKEIRVMKGRFK